MKILVVHNRYQQQGGEDLVADQESAALRDAGHQVCRYTRSNEEVTTWPVWRRATLPVRSVWGGDSPHELRALLRAERPDVAHFHNTHFLISPNAYQECRQLDIPVVQSIHNYRLVCPSAQLTRQGGPCEKCVGRRIAWPGVLHRCYRQSRAQTAMVAAGTAYHRWRGTWVQMVNRFLAPTDFVRRKLVEGGLPESLIAVKPNSVYPDPGVGKGPVVGQEYFLFVGRLSPEKGISTLLQAWRILGQRGSAPVLRIIGSGPLSEKVAETARSVAGIQWLGPQPPHRVLEAMKEAVALIFPSTWYEGFPLVIVEAFAVGLPVVTSNLGSMSTLVSDGDTGLHVPPGDPEALAEAVTRIAADIAATRRMGLAARTEFEAKYTAERNRERLVSIYQDVAGRHAD